MQPRLVGLRLVLAVRDLRAATQYYRDVLGCRLDFGDDCWSFLSRDEFSVMLGECRDERPATEIGDHSYVAYVVVDGIDALHGELSARGAAILAPPVSEPWGMREFGIRTPEGHRLRFGSPLR